MTDRELLELAAKAAGIDGQYGVFSDCIHYTDDGKYVYWNPLTSDADALRLAVKLMLEVGHNSFGNVLVDRHDRPEDKIIVEPHGNDPYAATRRAIVRAAAEIGKSL